ncbi:MAG: hypothetical protein GVY36_01155 [Verrucomicrobia bacterium]|nr:hypothetical protein [Verrucomicrobiota bacterium]
MKFGKEWFGEMRPKFDALLKAYLANGAWVRLRCPIVPGANDTPDHLDAIKRWQADSRIERVECLDYHTIGNAKYADLGRDAPTFG